MRECCSGLVASAMKACRRTRGAHEWNVGMITLLVGKEIVSGGRMQSGTMACLHTAMCETSFKIDFLPSFKNRVGKKRPPTTNF